LDFIAFQVQDLSRASCADLAPQALSLLDAFGLPKDALHAPIADDWVAFNEYDNQGELTTEEQFKSMLSGQGKK